MLKKRPTILIKNIFLFAFLYSLNSCEKQDDPICKECGNDVKYIKTFSGYLRYLTYPDGPRLVQRDSITKKDTAYHICYFNGMNDLEETKIIKAHGGFTKSCMGAADILQVDTFEIVNTCIGKISDIDKTFTLANVLWLIESIQVNGIAYQPPCEGDSYILFKSDSSYEVGVTDNSLYGYYSLADDKTIKSTIKTTTLFVGTNSQLIFGNAFAIAFGSVSLPDAILSYQLTKNHLILTNSTNNAIIKLFTR